MEVGGALSNNFLELHNTGALEAKKYQEGFRIRAPIESLGDEVNDLHRQFVVIGSDIKIISKLLLGLQSYYSKNVNINHIHCN